MFHVWIVGDWDQSYLSVSPFSDQVLFGRRRKEFNWHLYWNAELAISLLKSFFFTILSQPTFAEEDRYHEGTLSSHLGSDLFGHNFRPFSRPDFEEGDGTNHTSSEVRKHSLFKTIGIFWCNSRTNPFICTQLLSLWLQIHLKFQVIELLKSTKTLQNVAQTTLVWFQSFA